MAESFYTTGTPSSPHTYSNIPQQSPTSPTGPPPPPPPKPTASSHEQSHAGTPQLQTLPLTRPPLQSELQSQTVAGTSGVSTTCYTSSTEQHARGPPPPPPPPPPIPSSPSHAQALARQQQSQQQQQQQQSQGYNRLSQTYDPYQSTTSPPPLPQHPHQEQQYLPSHFSPPTSPNPNSNLSSNTNTNNIPQAPPPLDSGWLPEGLAAKPTADLQPLLNNPGLLTAFAHQHPSYQASLQPLEAYVAANMKLADHVLALETQVRQLREQTGQLLINHTSLQTQWRRKQSETDDALSPWGPRAMYQRLVASIAEQEAILRAVHESFLEGGAGNGDEFYGSGAGKASEKEVTEWVKRIREGTTVLEKRREMRARWDEGRVGGWR